MEAMDISLQEQVGGRCENRQEGSRDGDFLVGGLEHDFFRLIYG
jgi:hypothetical protein